MKPTLEDSYEIIDEYGLTQILGNGIAFDEVGYPNRVPVLFLRLEGKEFSEDLCRLLECVPAVVVGVTSKPVDRPPACDVLLTKVSNPPRPWIGCPTGTEATVTSLFESVRDHPIASVVFVQLLRLGATLSISDALTAESFAYSTLQSGPEHKKWSTTNNHRSQRSPTGDAIQVERTDESLTITLSRPEVHNAFNASMRDELVSALKIAAADPAIKVTIRGAGPSFCSGGDLNEFGSKPDPASAHIIRTSRSPGHWIAASAARITVHVHGTCVGAGVELAAFASRVKANEDTTFSLPEVSMGLVPGAGGTVSITRRVGRERTAYLGLIGNSIDVFTAQSWGLVDVMDA